VFVRKVEDFPQLSPGEFRHTTHLGLGGGVQADKRRGSGTRK